MAQGNPVPTPRELQVIWHMGRGLRNKEIAGALGIALKTVEAHGRSIFLTLGARNRIQAVVIAQDLSGLSLIRQTTPAEPLDRMVDRKVNKVAYHRREVGFTLAIPRRRRSKLQHTCQGKDQGKKVKHG